jgi:hypothetical protein
VELVDDLVLRSLDTVTDNWVENYAATEAVDNCCEILQSTIDLYFISHDKGNPEFEVKWAEDTPPKPSIIDSWMNGKVPVVKAALERFVMFTKKCIKGVLHVDLLAQVNFFYMIN